MDAIRRFERAIEEGYVVSATFDLMFEARRFQALATGHRQELRKQGYKTKTLREWVCGGTIVTVMKKSK